MKYSRFKTSPPIPDGIYYLVALHVDHPRIRPGSIGCILHRGDFDFVNSLINYPYLVHGLEGSEKPVVYGILNSEGNYVKFSANVSC